MSVPAVANCCHETNRSQGINTSSNFLQQFGNPSSSLLGTINAIYEIGCFGGAVTVFIFGDMLGRRKCLYVGAALMAIGAILQASSFGVAQMIVGRIVWYVNHSRIALFLHKKLTRSYLSGWGNGFNTATTPLWVSELSPAKSRGRLVAMEGSLIAFGIVIASYYNIGMSYATGPVVWRAPIASQIIFIVLQVALVLVLPESPRWLTKRMLPRGAWLREANCAHLDGRHHQALDILAQLKGTNTPLSNPSVLATKAEIDEALRLEQAAGPWSIKECFINGPLKIRRRYIMAIGVQAMQQLSGINVLVCSTSTTAIHPRQSC